MVDLGLLILRVVLGLTMAGHGAQKLFGWFGGHGLVGHLNFTNNVLRLRPGWLWGWVNILAELGGGLLLALGVFTPIAAAAIIAAMVMAVAVVHAPKGFWNTKGGYEYNLLIMAVAFALGIAGPGVFALAPSTPGGLPHWQIFAVSLAVSLAGVAVALIERSVVKAQAREARR